MANTYTDNLKLRMPAIGDINWGDEVNDNAQIMEQAVVQMLRENTIVSGLVPSLGTGLQIDYTAGTAVVNGTSYSISASNATCTASAVNWLYVDSAGVVQISTTPPIGHYSMIALIDADATAIARFADMRNIAASALGIDLTYSPDNYALDTSQPSEVEQHFAGVDNQLGFMSGYKNKIINGKFAIWQRGTSQTTSGYGSDDRWRNIHIGSTKTHSRQSFALGQTDVPGEPKYYSRTVVSSVAGADNFVFKDQRIEDVRTYAGDTCTLSFYAKADAAKDIAIEFVQYFGTGGSPSASVTGIGITTFSLTSSWEPYTATISIPSISDKQIGTNDDSALQIIIWLESGSTYGSRNNSLGQQSGTFDFYGIQLESGNIATAFEARHIGTELSLCQRYYWRGQLNGSGLASHYRPGITGYSFAGSVSFPVTMRKTPSVGIVTTPTYINCTHHSIAGNEYGFEHRVDVSAAGIFRVLSGVYDADAEL